MISPEAPYPLDGGGALRTASLLNYLAAHYDVDLIAFQHPRQQVFAGIPSGMLRGAYPVDLLPHRHGLLSRSLRNGLRLLKRRPPLVDRFSGYEDPIAAHLQGKNYEIAVLEHFWVASYIPLVRKFARQTVLDLHNIESAWHQSCAQASPFPRSAIHRAFARASLHRERTWLKSCDLALVSSSEDLARVREICPQVNPAVYPNAIPWRDLDIMPRPDFSITFSGNLEYEPNRIGLKFFLAEIWPSLIARFPQLVFRIIGKNDHAIRHDIQGIPGIQVTGPVKDPFEYLARALISIVPLLSGSGTRLKIIEAWAARKAVVSTTVGAEGLGAADGESIILADSPADFISSIERLLLNSETRNRIAAGGRARYERNFTWTAAWEALSGCLFDQKLR
jgi:polysaccharide biosynthesis protein PslH